MAQWLLYITRFFVSIMKLVIRPIYHILIIIWFYKQDDS